MAKIKFGFILPFADPVTVASLAPEMEAAGWDGVFLGEALWHHDAWVSLTAAAMVTKKLRLGTMLTPLPGFDPRKLAAESASLDNLSQGRVILSLGIGATWMGWQAFPDENTDRKARTEMLDEGIEILTGLYQSQPFDYNGKHYHFKLTAMDVQYYPPPSFQKPRIPIWTVGVWKRDKSMRRVLRCDGLLPTRMNESHQFVDLQPRDVREMKEYIQANRTLTTPFDIVVEGKTVGMSADQKVDKIMPWVEAGATWWMEGPYGVSKEEMIAHMQQGPVQL